jgi:hypothetical protein
MVTCTGTGRVEAEAVRVSVAAPAPSRGVTGLTLHTAETPAGRVDKLSFTSPAKEPAVAALTPTGADPPCGMDTVAVVAFRLNAGGRAASERQPLTNSAPSTEPRPVARLYVAPLAIKPVTPGTLFDPEGVGWKA